MPWGIARNRRRPASRSHEFYGEDYILDASAPLFTRRFREKTNDLATPFPGWRCWLLHPVRYGIVGANTANHRCRRKIHHTYGGPDFELAARQREHG